MDAVFILPLLRIFQDLGYSLEYTSELFCIFGIRTIHKYTEPVSSDFVQQCVFRQQVPQTSDFGPENHDPATRGSNYLSVSAELGAMMDATERRCVNPGRHFDRICAPNMHRVSVKILKSRLVTAPNGWWPPLNSIMSDVSVSLIFHEKKFKLHTIHFLLLYVWP